MSSASPAARGSPASRPVSGALGATGLAGPEAPTRPAVAAPGTASRVPRAVTARLAIVAALVAAGAVGARRPERLVERPEHAFRGALRGQVPSRAGASSVLWSTKRPR